MNNKVISIEIGSQRTKICEIDYKKKNPQVYQCINFDTPLDTFEDGYIRDKEKFTSVINTKLNESNMKSKKVIFTISSSKIANKEIMIPLIKENRIQDVIMANANDFFPVEISEYTLTYSILEKVMSKTTKQENKLRLSVFAAPNNLIKNYYSIAKMLSLDVEAIDYIGNSAYQIFRKQESENTKIIIQMNEHATLISFLNGEILKLQRTVPYGTSTVVEAVLHNSYYIIKSENDAIQLLYNKNLMNHESNELGAEVAATVIALEEDVIDQKLKELVSDSLKSLMSNILRVIDYYSSKNKAEKIDSIYITGQGSRFNGMRDLLQYETGIDVKVIQQLPNVIFPKNNHLDRFEQGEYISVIGAAIQPINFIPKEHLIKEKNHNRIHTRIFMLSGAVIISGLLSASSYLNYLSEREDNKLLIREIDNLSSISSVFLEHEVASNQYRTVKQMFAATNNPNQGLGELIDELEMRLPSQAVVETFMISSTSITLSIRTSSKETAAKVIQQLKLIPVMEQISTSGLTQEVDENGITTVRFIITGQYKNVTKEGSNENNE